MTVFTEIFKRVQLFFFAFTLAASSMMFVGMASGKLDRGVVYMGLAEKFATFFASNPTMMKMIASGSQMSGLDAQSRNIRSVRAAPSGPVIEAPQVTGTSLQALKQRQRQRIIPSGDVYTGG
ncbi:hypothetical protein BDE40_2092 [Litoreibacter halocynthiae]|uniref:Uncharacterized protein n=1 Tax=Litoreibacter halocynthiae TaxID=1242689 RepID=A0A4R7LHV1_9RHOB|nr:hypothetical protein [Litoreibacter halocynthiae]TDT75363.1 hypothetical protein BDE40_2092 [Litoreibacter halocynthiae]